MPFTKQVANLQIVEIFLSLQGEGKYTGNLAIFVRFAGCNFNCLGFGVQKQIKDKMITGCDTLRAVWTEEFKESYENLNLKKLLKRVFNLSKKIKPIIVITGGEPLIHHKNTEFIEFIKALQEENYEIHFESNGSIELDFEKYPFYKKCVFALSVKLENSGVSKQKRLNYKALKSFKQYAKDSFYKFVLDAKSLENSHKEILELLSLVPNKVFCMPMGENEARLKKNATKVAEFCIKNGYNYTDRIHIRLWGDKEGV